MSNLNLTDKELIELYKVSLDRLVDLENKLGKFLYDDNSPWENLDEWYNYHIDDREFDINIYSWEEGSKLHACVYECQMTHDGFWGTDDSVSDHLWERHGPITVGIHVTDKYDFYNYKDEHAIIERVIKCSK